MQREHLTGDDPFSASLPAVEQPAPGEDPFLSGNSAARVVMTAAAPTASHPANRAASFSTSPAQQPPKAGTSMRRSTYAGGSDDPFAGLLDNFGLAPAAPAPPPWAPAPPNLAAAAVAQPQRPPQTALNGSAGPPNGGPLAAAALPQPPAAATTVAPLYEPEQAPATEAAWQNPAGAAADTRRRREEFLAQMGSFLDGLETQQAGPPPQQQPPQQQTPLPATSTPAGAPQPSQQKQQQQQRAAAVPPAAAAASDWAAHPLGDIDGGAQPMPPAAVAAFADGPLPWRDDSGGGGGGGGSNSKGPAGYVPNGHAGVGGASGGSRPTAAAAALYGGASSLMQEASGADAYGLVTPLPGRSSLFGDDDGDAFGSAAPVPPAPAAAPLLADPLNWQGYPPEPHVASARASPPLPQPAAAAAAPPAAPATGVAAAAAAQKSRPRGGIDLEEARRRTALLTGGGGAMRLGGAGQGQAQYGAPSLAGHYGPAAPAAAATGGAGYGGYGPGVVSAAGGAYNSGGYGRFPDNDHLASPYDNSVGASGGYGASARTVTGAQPPAGPVAGVPAAAAAGASTGSYFNEDLLRQRRAAAAAAAAGPGQPAYLAPTAALGARNGREEPMAAAAAGDARDEWEKGSFINTTGRYEVTFGPGRLGFTLLRDDAGRGVVYRVHPQSMAKTLGVRRGDHLVAINRHPFPSYDDVMQTLPGVPRPVLLTFVRTDAASIPDLGPDAEAAAVSAYGDAAGGSGGGGGGGSAFGPIAAGGSGGLTAGAAGGPNPLEWLQEGWAKIDPFKPRPGNAAPGGIPSLSAAAGADATDWKVRRGSDFRGVVVRAFDGLFSWSLYGSSEGTEPGTTDTYTEYVMRCQWGPDAEHMVPWMVARRYREFDALDKDLRDAYPHLRASFPSLPPKELFKTSAEVVARRKVGLEQYMGYLLSTFPDVLAGSHVNRFLTITERISGVQQELRRRSGGGSNSRSSPRAASSATTMGAAGGRGSPSASPSGALRASGGGYGGYGAENGRASPTGWAGAGGGGALVGTDYILNTISSEEAFTVAQTQRLRPLRRDALLQAEATVCEFRLHVASVPAGADLFQDSRLFSLVERCQQLWPALKATAARIDEAEDPTALPRVLQADEDLEAAFRELRALLARRGFQTASV